MFDKILFGFLGFCLGSAVGLNLGLFPHLKTVVSFMLIPLGVLGFYLGLKIAKGHRTKIPEESFADYIFLSGNILGIQLLVMLPFFILLSVAIFYENLTLETLETIFNQAAISTWIWTWIVRIFLVIVLSWLGVRWIIKRGLLKPFHSPQKIVLLYVIGYLLLVGPTLYRHFLLEIITLVIVFVTLLLFLKRFIKEIAQGHTATNSAQS